MTYKLKEHEADMGVVGIGKTLNEAFSEGARAMFSIMCDLNRVEHVECAKIECSAENIEMLFVEFLNKLLAKADIRGMLFNEFNVSIKKEGKKYKLICNSCGEKLDQVKHATKIEVKAATLHGAKYEKKTKIVKGKKQTKHYIQCVVDV